MKDLFLLRGEWESVRVRETLSLTPSLTLSHSLSLSLEEDAPFWRLLGPLGASWGLLEPPGASWELRGYPAISEQHKHRNFTVRVAQ